jgi:hypothetical protein
MFRLRAFLLLSLSFGLLVEMACSGDGSPALPSGPVAGASTWELISPDGGTFTTVDDATVAVPVGALTVPTFIGVTRNPWPVTGINADVPSASGWPDFYSIEAIGPEFNIEPSDVKFMVPIIITIPFASGSGSAVVVATSSPGGPILPSTPVDATHVAAQASTGCSVFAGIVTHFEQGCTTAADCASGQSCPVHVCTGD